MNSFIMWIQNVCHAPIIIVTALIKESFVQARAKLKVELLIQTFLLWNGWEGFVERDYLMRVGGLRKMDIDALGAQGQGTVGIDAEIK